MNLLAAIDIGTLTARLLIVRRNDDAALFHPFLRKRAYIRLAEDFGREESGNIKEEAFERTLAALVEFSAEARTRGAVITRAVCTGIMREAKNREHLLDSAYRTTGIPLTVISGEEEAGLTRLGVTHFLTLPQRPCVIFDLGGGTTEFISVNHAEDVVKSIPLGALVLTEKFLSADPPEREALERLRMHVDAVLSEAFPGGRDSLPTEALVCTGGTVTTLAALAYGLERTDITPSRMNGLLLDIRGVRDLFLKMKGMTVAERASLPMMDESRARVILAGSLIVERILSFFEQNQATVCLSDILEGLLIEYINGVKDGAEGI